MASPLAPSADAGLSSLSMTPEKAAKAARIPSPPMATTPVTPVLPPSRSARLRLHTRDLFQSARSADVAEMAQALHAGADPNYGYKVVVGILSADSWSMPVPNSAAAEWPVPPGVKATEKDTLLMIALKCGREQVAHALLQAPGIDLKRRNIKGEDAAAVARAYGRTYILESLDLHAELGKRDAETAELRLQLKAMEEECQRREAEMAKLEEELRKSKGKRGNGGCFCS